MKKNKTEEAPSSEQSPGDGWTAVQGSPVNLSQHVSLLAFLWENSWGWRWNRSLLFVPLLLTSSQFRFQLGQKSSPPYPSAKTHSSSLSLHVIPLAFHFYAVPLLFVNMKSLRADTEVGFKGIIGHRFLQHVYQRAAAAAALCAEQQSSAVHQRAEEGGANTVHPRISSSSIMAIICHFSEGQRKNKDNGRRMKDVSGESSPLV